MKNLMCEKGAEGDFEKGEDAEVKRMTIIGTGIGVVALEDVL